MVWGGRREEGSGWGTRVYLWQIHFDIWQNQYNIVKLKNKIIIKNKKRTFQWLLHLHHFSLCILSFWLAPFPTWKMPHLLCFPFLIKTIQFQVPHLSGLTLDSGILEFSFKLYLFSYRKGILLLPHFFFLALSMLIRFCKYPVSKGRDWKLSQKGAKTLLWIFPNAFSANELQYLAA